MFGLNSKNAAEAMYVVVYRGAGTPGFEEPATRAQALAAFQGCIYTVDPGSTDYVITPFAGRRVYVTGPDYCIQPDDPTDPLLIGAAALKAVLAPQEYTAIVHGTVAAAALEA